MAAAIHNLKYRGRKRVANRLGRLMARVALSDPAFRGCEGLVPVPLRPEKLRERGYNPSALLAGSVSEATGIPVVHGALVKIRPTPSQTEIRPRDRTVNPRGSFRVVNPEGIAGIRLILVDDVATSGSTLAAAAGALLEGEAREIRVLTAARTPMGSLGYS